MSVRAALLDLPFVAEKEDGTLDLFDLRLAGVPQRDFVFGRHSSARLQFIMRQYDSPFLLSHFTDAFLMSSEFVRRRAYSFMEGFNLELGLACITSPDKTAEMVTSAPTPAQILASDNPFASDSPFQITHDNQCDVADITPTGDYETDTKQGRMLAGMMVGLMRQTCDPTLLWQGFLENGAEAREGDKAIRIGFFQAIAGVAMAAPIACTAVRESAYVLHRNFQAISEGSDLRDRLSA